MTNNKIKKEESEEPKKVALPFNFRVQQARNYLRLAFNTAAVNYELDGSVLSLIVESVLQEEYRQQVAYMAEQTDAIVSEIQKGESENE